MAVATAGQTVTVKPPGFMATLSSEWTKIRTVRATYIQAFLAIALGIVMAALIGFAIRSAWTNLSPQDKADFDPVSASFTGGVFSAVVLIVTGVTVFSYEYSSGMIRLTLTVTPSRGRLLAAKAAIVLAFTLFIGFFVTFGAFFATQIVLSTRDGIPTGHLSDGKTLQVLAAAWLLTPLFPLIGTTMGTILRSTASAITSVLVLYFAPSILGGLLPHFLQRNFIRFLPGVVTDSLLRVHPDKAAASYLAPPLAIVVVLIWLAVFFAVAYAFLTKRDV